MTRINGNLFFIHIPKTAGSAIEEALGSVSLLRTANSSPSIARRIFRRALNFKKSLLDRDSLEIGISSEHLFGWEKLPLCLQHLTLSELYWLGLVSPSELQASVFFTVVRHPLDRFISSWRSHHRCQRYPDINNYLEFITGSVLGAYHQPLLCHDDLSHYRRMCDFISTDGLPFQVNIKVLKFEDINEDWLKLGESLLNSNRWPDSSWPSLVRKGVSKSIYSVTPMSEETLQFISNFYHSDGVNFGYDLSIDSLRLRARSLSF